VGKKVRTWTRGSLKEEELRTGPQMNVDEGIDETCR
jgi:hypothetical protein